MEQYLKGSWLDFEAWVRKEIGSNFRWKVRPMDTPSKRRIVAELIRDTRKRHDGVYPMRDAFLERVEELSNKEDVNNDG